MEGVENALINTGISQKKKKIKKIDRHIAVLMQFGDVKILLFVWCLRINKSLKKYFGFLDF